MMIVSETEHTEESIKIDLEQVYIAASYVNAERGRLDMVQHLVSAAIAELEELLDERTRPPLKAVERV